MTARLPYLIALGVYVLVATAGLAAVLHVALVAIGGAS